MPLFPLGTVLYPGLVLPLHIFEERYRQLVRDLLEGPEPREFGVIAIRKGRETGVDGVSALYETGGEAAAALAAQAVQRSFRDYLDALATQGGARIDVPDLPDEPVLLSYVVAASMIVDLSERQVMLAEPDAESRLTAERDLLARETRILRRLTSTPATDLRSSPYNPN